LLSYAQVSNLSARQLMKQDVSSVTTSCQPITTFDIQIFRMLYAATLFVL